MRFAKSWTAAVATAVLFLPVVSHAAENAAAPARTPAPLYQIPADVNARKVNIYSEGTRLTGYVYTLKSTPATQRLPTIIMGHGWGGVQALLRQDAVEFVHEGYLVITLDYRGWGESDSRVILKNPAPDPKKTDFTAEVHAIREVLDPLDMAADWLNAIHWAFGEPQVDKNHVGLWGSSFGGTLVTYAGAHDSRIKAVHSQVTGPLLGSLVTQQVDPYTEATQRARGEIGYPPPGERKLMGLIGAPIANRFADYNPLYDINNASTVAFQWVLSENEQYLNNDEHAIAAYRRYAGPKNLVVLPGIGHYDIYGKARVQAHELARAWFDKYLKEAK